MHDDTKYVSFGSCGVTRVAVRFRLRQGLDNGDSPRAIYVIAN